MEISMKLVSPAQLARIVAALALAAAAPAFAAKADLPAPSKAQLAALCESCAIVGSVHQTSKKGKASGVGAVGGAVVGGVVGHKAGDGGTLATGAGAVVGGLLGNEIEKRVKKEKVWVTRVTQRDGKVETFETQDKPDFKIGEVVRIKDGKLADYKK
jgi:outer membrane lipoprotein SlyB